MKCLFLIFLKMKICVMKQFEIYIANLDPAKGTEMQKTRPVVIISPDEMNNCLKTIIIAPITSKIHSKIPTRIEIELDNVVNYVVLDQLRTLDKLRLYKFCGNLLDVEAQSVKDALIEMFS